MSGGIGFLEAGLESSVIELSLPVSLKTWWTPWLALAVLLLPGRAAAQAPDSAGAPLRERPRFTLHEIVIERNDSSVRIPGRWLLAATIAFPESLATQAYSRAARRSGVAPLTGAVLASQRSQQVMGLYRRVELVNAARRTLDSIRSAIPTDSTRARFDGIFRPHGEWIVDLHDAALAWAQSRIRGFRERDAWPALIASHWVDPQDSVAAPEALPKAIYGLAVLAATDSAAFRTATAGMRRADSVAANSVLALLQGYTESLRWYTEALEFLLNAAWLPEGGGKSVGDLVRSFWRGALGIDVAVAQATIQPRWFGYPQAVPQYGVPAQLFGHLVRAENAEGQAWLDRQGQAALLRSLRWLPQGDSTLALLRTGTETLRLTTVSRQAKESLNGFLEPRDAIAIDPGYSPLLALGAVVHEWQHLLFRSRQLEAVAARLSQRTTPVIGLPGIEPHLAEGFAEWSAERILEPLTRRWPLLALGELEKRAALVQTQADDQHVLGYALVRALAAALPDPRATTGLLLRHASAPSALLKEPSLSRAWSRYRGSADLTPAQKPPRLLLPEVTFTIEDGIPDVESTRILLPGLDAAAR
jgi:hypothetical protein